MTGLRVGSPGLFATVQDAGRSGYRDRGVPTSGVLDRDAFRLANALVGNDRDAAVLECLGIGPDLEAVDDAIRIAFVGDAPAAKIVRADGIRQPLPAGQSAMLVVGDRLSLGALKSFSVCLAVEGGVAVPPVLGSRSTYVRGGFGGIDGRPLRAGDLVPSHAANASRGERRLTQDWRRTPDVPVRVVLGPQDDAFTPDGIAAFLGADYTITTNADRMGFRFEGAKIAHVRSADIVSDGAVAGSIQVPGSGQPIVLLADGQSVGGYTKIATVIGADMPALVCRKPGERVRFAAVTQAEAEDFAREHETWLQGLMDTIEDFLDGLNVQALYDRNLVSGVVTAE